MPSQDQSKSTALGGEILRNGALLCVRSPFNTPMPKSMFDK